MTRFRRRKAASFRPAIETLEDRNLLSTYTVDRLTDLGQGSGLAGDLRYCITNATEGDDIQFGVTGTINLAGPLPNLTHSISIQGPGADRMTVRRDVGGTYRIFTVSGAPTITVSGLTLSNGLAPTPLNGTAIGGGIFVASGSFTLADSVLTNNRAAGPPGQSGQGGGVYVAGGMVAINGTTISANSANGGSAAIGGAGSGGGLFLAGGMVTITNTTISANSANGGIGSGPHGIGDGGAGSGGGLFWASGTVMITNTTISANSANGGRGGTCGTCRHGPGSGGGLFVAGGMVARNTILAGNTVGGLGQNSAPDLAGNLGSQGYNLIGNTEGGRGFDPTDLLNVNPLLGPLGNNGGSTQTMALLAGSPALSAGDPDQLGSPDQRGVARSGGVNIGAFQASATAFLLSAPDTVKSGTPFDVTVTAVDPFSQVAVGYTGTVTFSTSDPDPGVVLPADYTFTPDDGGSHTFSDIGLGETTLITPGDQTLTVTDTADDTITGSAIITVDSAAPRAGPHGLGQPPQPESLHGSAPQASASSHREMVAVDRLFASLNRWDSRFSLSLQTRHTRADGNSWALGPWWGDESLFL